MKRATGLRLMFAVFAFTAAHAASVNAAVSKDFNRPAVTVPAYDLDLSQEAEVAILYQRLQQAARQVCGLTGIQRSRSLVEWQGARSCYEEALSEAVRNVNNPALDAMHAG
jgi:UrcA family protein